MLNNPKKMYQVNIRINENDRMALTTIARAMDRTESDALRQLIRQWIANNKQQSETQQLPGV